MWKIGMIRKYLIYLFYFPDYAKTQEVLLQLTNVWRNYKEVFYVLWTFILWPISIFFTITIFLFEI